MYSRSRFGRTRSRRGIRIGTARRPLSIVNQIVASRELPVSLASPPSSRFHKNAFSSESQIFIRSFRSQVKESSFRRISRAHRSRHRRLGRLRWTAQYFISFSRHRSLPPSSAPLTALSLRLPVSLSSCSPPPAIFGQTHRLQDGADDFPIKNHKITSTIPRHVLPIIIIIEVIRARETSCYCRTVNYSSVIVDYNNYAF